MMEVRITLASNSEGCIFSRPNTISFVIVFMLGMHGEWATYSMHELYEVNTGNYDSYHWTQALFGGRIPKKLIKLIMKLASFHGIVILINWIEWTNKV